MDFDTMYKDHFDRVLRTAKSFMRNNEDALDATQDTFLKAYESLDSYDGSSALSTWLTQICINTCKDKLRKRKRENKVIYSGDNPEVRQLLTVGEEDNVTPDSVLEAEEEGDTVDTLFLQLPSNIKQALHLKLVEGLGYKEIAAEMDTSINTVKTWVRRGRKKLQQAFSPQ